VIVVGDAGLCVPSRIEPAALWRGLRVGRVDRRIAARVIRADRALRVRQTTHAAWEITGDSAPLRGWIERHLAAIEDARRRFVDIPEPEYEVRTALGWSRVDVATLARLAPRPGWFDVRPSGLVGWRWSDFDRIDYRIFWGDRVPSDDEIDRAAAEADVHLQGMVDEGVGLAPGPCPIVGTPRPLLERRPR
jgi:hypothetical protein